jgi:intraflagellar transport protein 172
VIVAVVLNL